MATQFAAAFPTTAPVPFLLRKSPRAESGGTFENALHAAVEAERAQAGSRKSCQRIAQFLCELGKAYGGRADLPLSRAAIASALGISLVRVKRTLGLLSLSGVLRCEGEGLTILDWRKLGGVARIEPPLMGLESGEDEDLICGGRADSNLRFMTANGDPACFV